MSGSLENRSDYLVALMLLDVSPSVTVAIFILLSMGLSDSFELFSCGCLVFFVTPFVVLPIKSIRKIKAVLVDSTVFPTESQFTD
jgi:hypothetical protein